MTQRKLIITLILNIVAALIIEWSHVIAYTYIIGVFILDAYIVYRLRNIL
jgi:hypothetical protein